MMNRTTYNIEFELYELKKRIEVLEKRFNEDENDKKERKEKKKKQRLWGGIFIIASTIISLMISASY